MVQTRTRGIELDFWCKFIFMVYTWTHGIDFDSWYRLRLMLKTWINGADIESCYRLGLMVRCSETGKHRKQRSRTKCLPPDNLSLENTAKSVKYLQLEYFLTRFAPTV